MNVASLIQTEIHNYVDQGLHPQIAQLVQHFVKYLKEPRYQAPLSMAELSYLFQGFYQDLYSAAIHVFTQSNSNKRHLLASSEYFGDHPTKFDYLIAIGNYSSSSIKLLKRTDAHANMQLRVFNFYKFIMIFESVQTAIAQLFASESTAETSLYDKVFRFDERDSIIQGFLDEKLDLLQQLKLDFSCFSEVSDESTAKISSLFDSSDHPTIAKINKKFTQLNESVTPYSKLRCIVKIQKYLMLFLSEAFDGDVSKINNDILLPSLIYLIIYHLPSREDLYLNFTFVQNFLSLLDPYKVDASYTQVTGVYVPNSQQKRSPKKAVSKSLYEYLNLDESSTRVDEVEEEDKFIDFFNNDRDLINYIQTLFLNSGELHYYLTNFEAILFFLLNVTIDELVSEPIEKPNSDLLTKSLHKLVDEEVAQAFKFPIQDEKVDKQVEEELQENRSRSSSLLNTISNRLNDAALSVERSRSNSKINKEMFPSSTNENMGDFESSLASPVTSNDQEDHSSLGIMKNILGRFGLVSVSNFRPSIDEVAEVDSKHRWLGSIKNKLPPVHTRTRSSSLDQFFMNNTRNNSTSSSDKRNSITSKLTNGVTEFMTKFGLTQEAGEMGNPMAHVSNASLHSLDESAKRPDYLSRHRTASFQVMDKWFNNLTNNDASNSATVTDVDSGNNDHVSNNDSVFSSPSDLTKYQHIDFDSLTIADLRNLKVLYDQLCAEVSLSKTESKTSEETEAVEALK